MSAWIRSVTGRAYHFEPLNAKQLERPSPFLPELRIFKALGVSWWKRSARGSSLSNELLPGGSRIAIFLKQYRIGCMTEGCAFCQRKVPTRGHHVVPRCRGGRDTAPTCHSCEDFIHKTWTHNELRDTFNTVEKIQADPRFQKFLRWLYKQQESAFFRTRRNRFRTRQPYR